MPKAVTAAFAANDPAEALLAALAWWRADRQPAIADLVDAISVRVSGLWVRDEQTWAKLARTRDPLVLGRLLAGVPAMPTAFLPMASALLAEFEPDPRIAAAIARWTLDPPTTSSSTYPFWTKALDLVATTGDVRAIAVLRKRLAMAQGDSQFWPKFYAALERACGKLEALPPPAKPDAAIAKLAGRVAKLPPLGELRASGIVAAATKRGDAPVLTGPLLSQAATHLAADRVAAAIDVLVVHWRDSRVPEVADLIDRASRLLPCWDRPLAESPKAMQAAWEAGFAEGRARMPQLLENLTSGAPKQLELRLVDLANLGDDPRIAMRLAQLAHGSGVSPERTLFWRSLFELLARHRDHRTIAPLMREFAGFAGRYYNHHRQGNRIFGPVAARAERPTLDAADAKLAAKLDAQLAAAFARARKTERALIAAIGDAPDDNGPRTVYADWLIEQGHPRGELVNLALVAKPSAAEESRHDELAGMPHIFGPLHDLAGDLELDRGLPVALAVDWNIGSLLWRELAPHPLLGAIQRIAFNEGYGTESQPTAQELAPVLAAAPRLATVTNVDRALADALAGTGFVRRGANLVRG